MVGLSHAGNADTHMSGGEQRKRVAISSMLLQRPEVIFGGDPTGNLDSVSDGHAASHRSEAQHGKTVIIVTRPSSPLVATGRSP